MGSMQISGLRIRAFVSLAFVLLFMMSSLPTYAEEIAIRSSRQVPVRDFAGRFHRIQSEETWSPHETALIICDVWDSHHCVNAVRRVQEIAPRIDTLAKTLRAHGATIIHSPSDCMPFYQSHPGRVRAQKVAAAPNLPADLNTWCDRIPSEESSNYPVDQSDGGEDDNLAEHAQWAKTLETLGRNPKAPWKQQIATIEIDPNSDFVSDSGPEVWNILESKKIKHVLLCGVHTNMCVLGRPFGLRQLSSHGKHVLLVRDLTDTMYNPNRWPFVNHFTGTDLVVDHIERYVCSTMTSDQVFRSLSPKVTSAYLQPHRFRLDKRPHLAILMAEDEYDTAMTLPQFASESLQRFLKISYVYGDLQEKAYVPGTEVIEEADALLVSARRRPLQPLDLERIRRFVLAGKPLIGIRTASHAFSLRTGNAAPGLQQWPEFDGYALGGNYTNHYANDLATTVLTKQNQEIFVSKGSLYKVSPLKPGTEVIWYGKVTGQSEEPVVWTFVRPDGGSSFYTSLGYKSDFEQPAFRELLANAVLRACGVQEWESVALEKHRSDYLHGKGRQR